MTAPELSEIELLDDRSPEPPAGTGRRTGRAVALLLTGVVIVGVVLAVTADSAAWQEEDYHLREQLLEGPFLGDRVALLITNRRVVGFDGGSGNLVERSVGPQERVIARAVGANVAVAVTDRRAMAVSPFRGGFFEIDLRPNEKFEGVEAAANLATVRTSRRLLTFRAPSGVWSERRTGIGN